MRKRYWVLIGVVVVVLVVAIVPIIVQFATLGPVEQQQPDQGGGVISDLLTGDR